MLLCLDVSRVRSMLVPVLPYNSRRLRRGLPSLTDYTQPLTVTHSSCCSCTALRVPHLTRSPSVSTKDHFPFSHGILRNFSHQQTRSRKGFGCCAVPGLNGYGCATEACLRPPTAKVRKAAVCRRILYCSLVWTHACDALRDISIVQHSLTTTT